MTAAPLPDGFVEPGLIERVAHAIDEADCGYSINLTRLVDGEATYTAVVGGKTREFDCHEDASEWVGTFRRKAKALAAIIAYRKDASHDHS
jgi:hypothetical protein